MPIRRRPSWTHVEVNWLAQPQGSHFSPAKGVVKESNPRTNPYRAAVAAACQEQLGPDWVPLDGPLEAEIVFRLLPPPKSDPNRRFPTTPPDLDKLVRATFDGLTKGRLWKDDARCTRLVTEKVHAITEETTSVTIRVRKRL